MFIFSKANKNIGLQLLGPRGMEAKMRARHGEKSRDGTSLRRRENEGRSPSLPHRSSLHQVKSYRDREETSFNNRQYNRYSNCSNNWHEKHQNNTHYNDYKNCQLQYERPIPPSRSIPTLNLQDYYDFVNFNIDTVNSMRG